ncbi:glutathione peroxidase [Novosphingobium decolorationis]|uniref:Glutathione peroxidase n=1 Tax=Novosphingobium decolorationis TaxID=2698673 RepID=A0ABX8E744_9SPHN|nr:glutathione peroxidase [Novosphingobium decolorationis]QVM84839.1 glutathione peroxidase [Novosphingobium decolorationis]
MTDIATIPLTRIDGTPDTLGAHQGKVLLIVNVASKCGLTPQYEGLEELFQQYKDKGLEILGFPANDFGAQEPGSHEEIAEFCKLNYGVSFPLFAKADVTGADMQPLYKELTQAHPTKQGPAEEFRERLRGFGRTPTEDPDVLWNFEKFLVSKDGKVVDRFAPGVAPKDPALVAAIEAELAK